MNLPHPIQYQGSKRILAPQILQYFPDGINRLIEPFAGTAAISIASAHINLAKEYYLNDNNKPLIELLYLIVNEPENVSDSYREIWSGQTYNSIEHYFLMRDEFNKSHDPRLFLYLLARCAKGSIRYNSKGLFNQSPDKRRRGTTPFKMGKNIFGVSNLLKEKTLFFNLDYKAFLEGLEFSSDDLIYMDPPYQGVCSKRDSRYLSTIDFDEFVRILEKLNDKGLSYLISYDGKTGDKEYGSKLPKKLDLTYIEIAAGRSTQSTLLGKKEYTFESLYISMPLLKKLKQKSDFTTPKIIKQMSLQF